MMFHFSIPGPSLIVLSLLPAEGIVAAPAQVWGDGAAVLKMVLLGHSDTKVEVKYTWNAPLSPMTTRIELLYRP